MNNATSKGFTLIEILVVVGLLTMSAIYFTQLFIEKSEEKIALRETASFMTIRAAAVGYLQDEGAWRNQTSDDGPCHDMVISLVVDGYLGGVDGDYTGFQTHCDAVGGKYPLLTVTRTGIGSVGVANMVEAMLPSSSSVADDVVMYVPRPRMPLVPYVGQTTAEGANDVAPYISGCSREDREIIAYPNIVCSNGDSLGGFRVSVEEDNSRGHNHWHVSLEAKIDDRDGNYSRVTQCRVGTSSYESVSFNYIGYCNEDP